MFHMESFSLIWVKISIMTFHFWEKDILHMVHKIFLCEYVPHKKYHSCEWFLICVTIRVTWFTSKWIHTYGECEWFRISVSTNVFQNLIYQETSYIMSMSGFSFVCVRIVPHNIWFMKDFLHIVHVNGFSFVWMSQGMIYEKNGACEWFLIYVSTCVLPDMIHDKKTSYIGCMWMISHFCGYENV